MEREVFSSQELRRWAIDRAIQMRSDFLGEDTAAEIVSDAKHFCEFAEPSQGD